MKLLIVDNHSKHISEIIYSFNNLDVDVVSASKLNKVNVSLYDAFVLSGSSKYAILSHLNMYSSEIELIKKSNKPILGICLGFELICYAFDEKLVFHKERTKGELEIEFILEDKLLKNVSSPLIVYESHRWTVSKTNFLKILAKSNQGAEIIKHPTKPIYGLQFHPEAITNKQQQIINNFIHIAKLS